MRIAKAILLCGLTASILVGLGTVSARQAPSARDGVAASIERAASLAIDTGARLYNDGDVQGCYRVYQGALIGFGPVLDANPDLQRKVLAHLSEASGRRETSEKAFALRKALDEVLKTAKSAYPPRKPAASESAKTGMEPSPARTEVAAKPKGAEAAGPSLFTRLGGRPTLRPAVKDWLDRALADPKVNFARGGKYSLDEVGRANLELLLLQYVIELAGGGEAYIGRTMGDAHRGMKIDDAEFNAFLTHLGDALKKAGAERDAAAELVALLAARRAELVDMKATEPAPGLPADPPSPIRVAAPGGKPLWERVGGEPVVTAVVKDLLDKALANPNVDFTRGGKHPIDAAARARLERRFLEYIASRSGGPLKYAGKDMKTAHAGMGITADQFDALGGDLIIVMKKHGVADELIDETLGVFNGAFEPVVEKK